MPDITMCSGKGCDIKQDCYRFTAEPNPYRQSYFCEPPCFRIENQEQQCEYFSANSEYKPKTERKQSCKWKSVVQFK